MHSRPVMKSIWDEVFPEEADSYDNNIVEVLFNSQAIDRMYTSSDNVGKLEIFLDIVPFDEFNVQGETIHRRLTAIEAFVFVFPAREFLVGQMTKNICIYPDIVRFDIVTTGSLLSFECDSYSIDDLPTTI